MVTFSAASRTDNWGFVELAICCYTKILNESQGIHTKIVYYKFTSLQITYVYCVLHNTGNFATLRF